jgi:hypothetical protein
MLAAHFLFIKVADTNMRRLMTTGAAALVVFLSLGINSAAQQPTRESLESKKKRLSALEASLAESKRKSTDIESQLEALHKSIEEQQEELSELREDIPIEEEYFAFLDSPPRTILAISDSDTYLIDFSGTRRLVKLHGIYIDPLRSAEITKAFKKRLVKKSVYVRCADPGCDLVYLYGSKTGQSLNVELVKGGLARAAGDSRYDVAAYLNGITTPSPSNSSDYGSSRSTPGTDVRVRGHYRKDGTYVRPHTRSAPGSKSGGRSGGSRRR